MSDARATSKCGWSADFSHRPLRCRHDHRRLATAALTAVVSTAAARAAICAPRRQHGAGGGPPSGGSEFAAPWRRRLQQLAMTMAAATPTAALTAVVTTAAACAFRTARQPPRRQPAWRQPPRRQPPLGGSLRSAAASSAAASSVAASSAAAASPLPPLRSPTPHRSPRSAAVVRQRRSQMLRRSSRFGSGDLASSQTLRRSPPSSGRLAAARGDAAPLAAFGIGGWQPHPPTLCRSPCSAAVLADAPEAENCE